MVTFILPGYSVKNKEWLEDTAKNIKVDGLIRAIHWDHWTDTEQKFDVEEKAKLISGLSKQKEINIVAKSIGTLVASYVIKNNFEQIMKVIFCGIPLTDLTQQNKETMKDNLKDFPVDKIIVFQNDEDPHGSFAEVQEFLRGINPNIKIVSKPGEDHNYPYYEDFQKFLMP